MKRREYPLKFIPHRTVEDRLKDLSSTAMALVVVFLLLGWVLGWKVSWFSMGSFCLGYILAKVRP